MDELSFVYELPCRGTRNPLRAIVVGGLPAPVLVMRLLACPRMNLGSSGSSGAPLGIGHCGRHQARGSDCPWHDFGCRRTDRGADLAGHLPAPRVIAGIGKGHFDQNFGLVWGLVELADAKGLKSGRLPSVQKTLSILGTLSL